jgi:dynein heavy chain
MISVDSLSFDFLVQAGGDDTQSLPAPKEGCYMKGMILEGAKWDMNQACLCEPDPMALYAPMPVIHFKPVQKKKTSGAADIYGCPLYLYPVRTGTRERPSFVCYIDIKSGAVDPGFWIKRGTALLLCIA